MKVTQAFKSLEIDADHDMAAAVSSGTGIVSVSFTGWTAITGIVVQSNGKIDLAVQTSSGGGDETGTELVFADVAAPLTSYAYAKSVQPGPLDLAGA